MNSSSLASAQDYAADCTTYSKLSKKYFTRARKIYHENFRRKSFSDVVAGLTETNQEPDLCSASKEAGYNAGKMVVAYSVGWRNYINARGYCRRVFKNSGPHFDQLAKRFKSFEPKVRKVANQKFLLFTNQDFIKRCGKLANYQ